MSIEKCQLSPATGSAAPAAVAHINGVPLHGAGEMLTPDELRQRACLEMLRQTAQAEGFLDAADVPRADGVTSEAASRAIDTLLERRLDVPEPEEDACRRYYAAHAEHFRTGEKVHARHILFALTPGMDVVALRDRAEACLLDVRCHDGSASGNFSHAAREFSNCPSGTEDGDLGWLAGTDCAPEFARELFGRTEVGVLPRLVHSRFGLHVVEVLARERGIDQPFETVRGAVAMSLRRQCYVTALRQFLRRSFGRAIIEGIDLDADD